MQRFLVTPRGSQIAIRSGPLPSGHSKNFFVLAFTSGVQAGPWSEKGDVSNGFLLKWYPFACFGRSVLKVCMMFLPYFLECKRSFGACSLAVRVFANAL